MIYEWLSELPLNEQSMLVAISVLVICLLCGGLILYSSRLPQREESDEKLENLKRVEWDQEQQDDSLIIEEEAQKFYSKPSTLRYPLSGKPGLERLQNIQSERHLSSSIKEEGLNLSPENISPEGKSDEVPPWNQALISSITYKKAPHWKG